MFTEISTKLTSLRDSDLYEIFFYLFVLFLWTQLENKTGLYVYSLTNYN